MRKLIAAIIVVSCPVTARGYPLSKPGHAIQRSILPDSAAGGAIGGTTENCAVVSGLCNAFSKPVFCRLTLMHCNGQICFWNVEMLCKCDSEYFEAGSKCLPIPCPAGSYGNDIVGGCESCATATGNPNATSAMGSKLITDCFVPSSAVMNEKYGTYKFATDCYWQ